MLKVGITGSIGSGKSTVCKLFELLGVPVYYADDAAKRLMAEDQELKQKINELFEGKAYTKDDQLDRKYIAGIVFNDKKKLGALNALVHPAVAKDTASWQIKQQAIYTLKEAALLIESGSHTKLDKIIVVHAPLEIRIARVMARDGSSRDEVLARENKQLSPSDKIKHADFTIENHQTDLVDLVLKTHQKLLQNQSIQ